MIVHCIFKRTTDCIKPTADRTFEGLFIFVGEVQTGKSVCA